MKPAKDEEKREILHDEVKPRLLHDLKNYILQNDRMKVVAIVYTAILLSIGGAMFSLFCLIVCGDGDSTPSFHAYLVVCAIVYGASILAAAIVITKEK
jgi:hypothetical protein